MKIFVTVGTTPFNSLIKAVDTQLCDTYKVLSQKSDGLYLPVNHDYFKYSEDIESYYKNADLVISHGGAGSIYALLELQKKLVIVPNLDRVDSHQTDICDFMLKNNHALVCYDLESLSEVVEQAFTTEFVPYKSEEFIGIEKIRNYLGLGD